MKLARRFAAPLLALSLAALAAAPASAQTPLSFEGRAGLGIPTGELNEFVDPGVSLGAAVGYEIAGPLKVVLEGEMQDWSADEGDVRAWRALGGLRLDVPTLILPFSLSAEAVAGGTFYDTESPIAIPEAPPARVELMDDAFTLGGGVAVGFDPLPIVDLLLRADVRWVAAEASSVTGLNGQTTEGFDGLTSFPIRAAVRISL